MGQEGAAGEGGGGAGGAGGGGAELDFGGGGAAWRQRSAGELARAWLVLRLCSSPTLVRHAPALLVTSRRVLGRRLWGSLLRASFYGQFVGGATRAELVATAARLRALGMRPLLALPAEDAGERESQGEGWFEANQRAALEGAGLAAATGPEPLMQLKVTALMGARLCERISGLLAQGCPSLCLERVADVMAGEPPNFPPLTPEENRHFGESLRRLEGVAQHASGLGVGLLVDAELSALNPALSLVTLALMTRHNRPSPRVWNTYQAYLRDGRSRLAADAAAVGRRGAGFGVKLVRGAYAREEARRGGGALVGGLEEAHRSYAACLELALSLVGAGARLMVATHNEASVRHAARRMQELGIPRQGGGVCFAQLLGMSDHISLALGSAGYTVYKSTPWGPAEAALPYLARRAEENQGVAGGAGPERRLLLRELRRRLLRLP